MSRLKVAAASAAGLLIAAALLVSLRAPQPAILLAFAALLIVVLVVREPISDALNGWWLQRSPSVQPGHYIRIEGKQDLEGHVLRIGTRWTDIQTPMGGLERIPNSTLANSIFTNFTVAHTRDAVLVDVDADAAAQPSRVQRLLEAEAEAAGGRSPGIVPGSQRVCELPGRVPGTRRFVLHCRARNAHDRDDLCEELSRRVRHRLHHNGISTLSLTFTDQQD